MWLLWLCSCASAGGVLYGRQVAVSDRLKEEKRTRVMELLQQLGGVSACVGVAVGVLVYVCTCEENSTDSMWSAYYGLLVTCGHS